MVQGSVVILLNLALLDVEFRAAILNMGFVKYVFLLALSFLYMISLFLFSSPLI